MNVQIKNFLDLLLAVATVLTPLVAHRLTARWRSSTDHDPSASTPVRTFTSAGGLPLFDQDRPEEV